MNNLGIVASVEFDAIKIAIHKVLKNVKYLPVLQIIYL